MRPDRAVVLAHRVVGAHGGGQGSYAEPGGGSAAGRITVDDLATAGTKVYQAICPDSPHAAGTQEDIYRILRDLGTIFGVADQAAQRIEAMRQKIADVQAKIAGRPPVKVLFYGEGEGPLITVGNAALADEMITLAGGMNVFHDSSDGYFEAPLESVAATSPDVLYVNSRSSGAPFGAPDDGQAKADYLYKTFPNMPASRDRRAAFTTYLENEPGWRFADAVENLARVLHPNAFK
ncbi:MAG: ABC transporter substrate-binding protein [Pseudonocardiaceae bacterium]